MRHKIHPFNIKAVMLDIPDLLDPNCLQTLIAGRKSTKRERDYMALAHKSFVLTWFLRISKHNDWVSVNQSASDEGPMYTLIEIY